MGISASIFLLAVGAILAFAVNVNTRGLDLNMVGVILMIVGAVGLVVSMMFWSSWGGWTRRAVEVDHVDAVDDVQPHRHVR